MLMLPAQQTLMAQEPTPDEEVTIPVDPETVATLIDQLVDLENQLNSTNSVDVAAGWGLKLLIGVAISASLIKTETSVFKMFFEMTGILDRAQKGAPRTVVIFIMAVGGGIFWAWQVKGNLFDDAPYMFIQNWSINGQIIMTGILVGAASIVAHPVLVAIETWGKSVQSSRATS